MSEPRRLSDPDVVRAFALAGNARLTLVSRKTGARYTYRVRRPKDDGKPGLATHFVGVLTGADNEGDYSYLGFLRRGWDADVPTTWEHGRKSTIGRDAPSAVAWRWFTEHVLLSAATDFPEQLEVWHEGTCGKCGRALTVPESIERGLGPKCAGGL